MRGHSIAIIWMLAFGYAVPAAAQQYGPFNAVLPGGGDAVTQSLGDTAVAAGDWTLEGWIEPSRLSRGITLVAGFGDRPDGPRRFLALVYGRPALVTEAGTIVAAAPIVVKRWTYVVAVMREGRATLFVDGRAVAKRGLQVAPVMPVATLAPRGGTVFAGRLAGFQLDGKARSDIAERAKSTPDALTVYQTGSPNWPVQVKQMYGQKAPQDAWTRPISNSPIPTPVAKPLPIGPAIIAAGPDRWTIAGWRLAAAPMVTASGAMLSRTGFDAGGWYPATVPGTVLTTLVDRGVYPDPTYGLNNSRVPESLAHQDYWYRSEFVAPAIAMGRQQILTFGGVNYAAEIWVNGRMVGTMKGAFIRGRFDVTGLLVPGRNAVAVRDSPPPHPGIAHEKSLSAGAGENGGMMMLDGPTFFATEGWDWLPPIRDRDTGLWQGVTLSAIGAVGIGDPQVVTTLPRADNSVADVEITTPVTNASTAAIATIVRAAFDDVTVEKSVTIPPGHTVDVVMRPAEFPALSVRHPALWWPNGYGDPALHTLTVTASADGTESDTKTLRFGMRQVTYDLSLIDRDGDLKRVGIDPSKARGRGETIVDETHTGIRKIAGGWAASLAPGADVSPAVTAVRDAPGLSPYLVIRVNGVKIAARGGDIGMDDAMKRIERARIEPMFRLQKDAHLNIIRNWAGQNTEDVFYDLADEYGLMVLNDFWESTQDYNIEAEDPALFLANATDAVKRYRNHPSIVLWFGRNEGVPQPILNEGLQHLVAKEDGTRLYMASSNRVNLQRSGPYNWRPPVEYFTTHAKGFAVEVGTPSLPTLEAWRRTIPAADQWPISDSWSYHDWHQTGNGAVKTYMDALARRFGPGTDLPDFERKAQMMQYESYRAIFEGMNAGLWTENSGRMLWMTQPAWPSSTWQIFSSDYDTQASFYGVKKAAEPVHVQMNLPDGKVVVVNNGLTDLRGLHVTAKAVSLDNHPLADRDVTLTAVHEAATPAFTLDLPAILSGGVALIRLEATDAAGTLVSNNVYWQGADDAAFRALNGLAPVTLQTRATSRIDGDETVATVTLTDTGPTPALETKLTMMNTDGTQILPAYFSDNYVSLLPGDTRTVEIRYSTAQAKTPFVALRGWNVAAARVAVAR